MQPQKKVGLALSGGAVLGIAHLGVIKVLEENEIPIHCVAGTSAGSLAGAFLAAGYTSSHLWDLVKDLSWGKIGRVTVPRMGLLNSKLLQRYVERKLGKISFSGLKMPFAAVAVDITTGEEMVFTEGSVAEAVRASCIIPGILTPLEKDGRIYVDGGLRNFLPVDVARQLGADYVIAVKLVPSIRKRKRPENVIQIMINSFDLVVRRLGEGSPGGDTNIQPNLEGLNAYDFDQAEELLNRGEAAARKVIPQIKQDLEGVPLIKGIWKRVKETFTVGDRYQG
ncbi:patatin-like phospholipase family protein [candidate division KSB1 bacterium]|nr:patatin-like phospholipase family protein [candidate division KSB1 bacterium]